MSFARLRLQSVTEVNHHLGTTALASRAFGRQTRGILGVTTREKLVYLLVLGLSMKCFMIQLHFIERMFPWICYDNGGMS